MNDKIIELVALLGEYIKLQKNADSAERPLAHAYELQECTRAMKDIVDEFERDASNSFMEHFEAADFEAHQQAMEALGFSDSS